MSTPEVTYDLIHKVLYGYPSGEAEPAVFKIVKKIADATGDLLVKQGPRIRRQITIEGQKAGVVPSSYPYLYYLLDTREDDWPLKVEWARNVLFLLRAILQESGDMPAYKHLLQTPVLEQEKAVDQVFLGLANFGYSLVTEIGHSYLKILKKNLWTAMADYRVEGEDDLNALVVKMVKRNPGYYSSGLVTKAFFDSYLGHIV